MQPGAAGVVKEKKTTTLSGVSAFRMSLPANTPKSNGPPLPRYVEWMGSSAVLS